MIKFQLPFWRSGKISAQPHPILCIQFLDRENNDKNNTLPLGKQIMTVVKGLLWLVTNHRAVFCTMWRKWTNQKPEFGLLLRLWKISGPSQKWCDMGQGKDVTQEGPYGIWTHDLCDTDAALYPYVLPIRAWIFSRTGLNFYALSVRSTRTLHPGLISTNSLVVFITARIDSIFVF